MFNPSQSKQTRLRPPKASSESIFFNPKATDPPPKVAINGFPSTTKVEYCWIPPPATPPGVGRTPSPWPCSPKNLLPQSSPVLVRPRRFAQPPLGAAVSQGRGDRTVGRNRGGQQLTTGEGLSKQLAGRQPVVFYSQTPGPTHPPPGIYTVGLSVLNGGKRDQPAHLVQPCACFWPPESPAPPVP